MCYYHPANYEYQLWARRVANSGGGRVRLLCLEEHGTNFAGIGIFLEREKRSVCLSCRFARRLRHSERSAASVFILGIPILRIEHVDRGRGVKADFSHDNGGIQKAPAVGSSFGRWRCAFWRSTGSSSNGRAIPRGMCRPPPGHHAGRVPSSPQQL